MRPVVWIGAAGAAYPEGGGFHWTYLNWALGCLACGCDVVWLDMLPDGLSAEEAVARADALEHRLEPFGLAGRLALRSDSGAPLPDEVTDGRVPLEAAADADLFLDLSYCCGHTITDRFRRTALLDIDPGLLQLWLASGELELPRYDTYFTIGETVGRPDAGFPDAGIPWRYTPPCVSLEHWPVVRTNGDSAFTTVSSWDAPEEWVAGDAAGYLNDKRSGFEAYLELPRRTGERLELALCLAADEELRLDPDQEEQRERLADLGWSIVHSHEVAATPEDYRYYIQGSRGEFSCAKPSCRRLQNAWVSDRSLCYLASGKPVVVEDTGPSAVLDECPGVLRFGSVEEAGRQLDALADSYEEHCRGARALAEELFDARKVAGYVLEQALA
jgi:hypothetical protein